MDSVQQAYRSNFEKFHVRPFEQFLDRDKFSKPDGNKGPERIRDNLQYFFGNYVVASLSFVFAGYFFLAATIGYGAFTPLLILSVILCVVHSYFRERPPASKLVNFIESVSADVKGKNQTNIEIRSNQQQRSSGPFRDFKKDLKSKFR
mmetsp:Transcript_23136/g.64990  ORF Transcript_23136/g.64990 Transcript_23136/m.64990 type:complete len:148 (-) Transcript_23136:107-550(-)